ncbi:HlyD family efflux transporter periplasmic adaptor subunit [Candidatus Gracilibacteria bacterium]|nr:HlyD family efflux transporter periplasmic adaptor subunit [Candidatus Gracilibacteria bacterium]
MKKIISLFLLTLLLISCGKTEETVKNTKKDFLVQIKPLDSLGSNSFLKKSGKIEGKEDIKLSSQGIGRIGNIAVKEGEKVRAGQNIVFLDDTVANYGLNLDRAGVSIERLQINYDSTKVSLDKQIFDLEIALEKLENSLKTLKTTSSVDISQAQDNLNNSDYEGMDTKSSLELQKLDNSISKAELDYNNALSNNKETIENFKNSTKKEYLTQKMFLDDIITFGDKLFDITGLYEDDVKKFDDFFGAKDMLLKSKTEEELKNLVKIKETLNSMNFDKENLTEENLLDFLLVIETNYTTIDRYLTSLEKTINNSLISVGQLGQTQIDAYVATTNAYQSQLTINNSAFIGFNNSASSFLKTYKNTESSLAKQLELLKKDRDIFVKSYDLGTTSSENTLTKVVTSSEDAINSIELQIKQTVESIKTAKESRDLTLKGIENSMREAYIAQNLAAREYNKLNITASIDGVIGDIFVDEGQDVSMGTPILTIISDKASQVELYFKESELQYIDVGDPVYTKIGEKSLTGTIYSVSSISDDSLNYKVLAVFNEKIQNLGGVIDVSVPIKSKSILLPIKNVKLVGTNKGTIYIYDNKKVVQKEVLLGKMYKEDIEFLGFLDSKINPKKAFIVTSDFTNYDENKFNIKIEQ